VPINQITNKNLQRNVIKTTKKNNLINSVNLSFIIRNTLIKDIILER